MTELKSFKKYSWLISGIIAIIVGISAISVTDLSFLPEDYKTYAVAIIAIAGIIVKIIPENYRVSVAEDLVRNDLKDKNTVTVNVDSEEIVKQVKDYIDEKYGDELSTEIMHDEIPDIDPSQEYEQLGDDDGGC